MQVNTGLSDCFDATVANGCTSCKINGDNAWASCKEIANSVIRNLCTALKSKVKHRDEICRDLRMFIEIDTPNNS